MSFIPVNEPCFAGNESAYLKDCIDTGWISSEGRFVNQFEKNLADLVGRKYGVAVTNGTAAIDLSISVLGIGKGDEVIVPTFTIISCIAQILRVGAVPVFIDAEISTWNMDVNLVESKITSKTKAILAVHIYGLPVDIKPLQALADKYDLFLIEDAAEVIGQSYDNQPCGSFGDISTFSFYPNKHITTGEGGMLLTNNPHFADLANQRRNLCFGRSDRFIHEDLGWNLRMTNLQAAVGVAQLERLNETVRKKRFIGNRYHELLSHREDLRLPLRQWKSAENIFWVFGIVLDGKGPTAKQICKDLETKGIGTRPFFYPMHRQPIVTQMLGADTSVYPVADYLAEYGFYVPSGVSLTDEQMDIVVKCLISCLDKYARA